MKVFCTVLFLGFFAATRGLPAGRDDVEFVSLDANPGNSGVVAAGPWPTPFDGLFSSFASMISRMRQQMEFLLRHGPGGNRTGEVLPFPPLGGLDLGKGNTTSVTKVIDGHKVVINETEFKHEGDFGGSFVRVRVIDVQPDSSELTTEKDAEEITTKDAESVENSFENEISKNKEVEVFNRIDATPSQHAASKLTSEFAEEVPENTDQSGKWGGLETFSIEDNDIETVPVINLSNDIYVNQIMADAGVPPNPDAEVFSSVESNVPPKLVENVNFPR